MEKDSFFILLVFDIRCQWREPTPVKRGRWELGTPVVSAANEKRLIVNC
jgi:hypothetical protein